MITPRIVTALAFWIAASAHFSEAQEFASTWQSPTRDLEAYFATPSVQAGDTVELFVSGRFSSVFIEFLAWGQEKEAIVRMFADCELQQIPSDADALGCGWSPTAELVIPNETPSGLYYARVSGASPDGAKSQQAEFRIPIVVRPEYPGAQASLLVLTADITVQAYNDWGGRSLYVGKDGRRTPRVSFDRPSRPGEKGSLEWQWPIELPAWLKDRRIDAEFASELDLQRDASLLDAYDLVLLTGHHEYWTMEMRSSLDAFVANGGRVLVLTANTASWQVRLEEDCSQIVCYKNPIRDPLFKSQDPQLRAKTTSLFLYPPINNSEERTFGLSFLHATYVTVDKDIESSGISLPGVFPQYPWRSGYGAFEVFLPEHPALRDLGLRVGDMLGAPPRSSTGDLLGPGLAILEVDGAIIEGPREAVRASGVFGAPRNLNVLCAAPAGRGFTVISSHRSFGEVVNAGTQGFRFLFDSTEQSPQLAERFVLSSLSRLTQGRRSLLRGGGFERWIDGLPLDAISSDGILYPTQSQWSGRQALCLVGPIPSSIAFEFDLPESDQIVVGFFAELAEGATAALRVVDADGLTCWESEFGKSDRAYRLFEVPLGDAHSPLRLVIERSGEGALTLDQLEICPVGRLDDDSLCLLSPAELLGSNASYSLSPTPGGIMQVVWIRELRGTPEAIIRIRDREDGSIVTEHSLKDLRAAPIGGGRGLGFVFVSPSPGGVSRLALEIECPVDGRLVHAGVRVHSLYVDGEYSQDPSLNRRSSQPGLDSRLVEDRIANGGFELRPDSTLNTLDWSSRPPGWVQSRRGAARLTDERAFQGEGSLVLLPSTGPNPSAASASMLLAGPHPTKSPVVLEVRVWCEEGAQGEITLHCINPQPGAGIQALEQLGSQKTTATQEWEHLRIALEPDPSTNDNFSVARFPVIQLHAQGGRVWFDALLFE